MSLRPPVLEPPKTEEPAAESRTEQVAETENLADRIGNVGWGLFLVWMGILFLGGLSTAAGLMGIGILTLGVQTARHAFGLPLERFWVTGGTLFLVGSLWESIQPTLPLVSVVFVFLGAWAVYRALRR